MKELTLIKCPFKELLLLAKILPFFTGFFKRNIQNVISFNKLHDKIALTPHLFTLDSHHASPLGD